MTRKSTRTMVSGRERSETGLCVVSGLRDGGGGMKVK